jgi:hypothetical protein
MWFVSVSVMEVRKCLDDFRRTRDGGFWQLCGAQTCEDLVLRNEEESENLRLGEVEYLEMTM